ncbi:MAG: exodeoxyribonuclease VII small subunit [Chloroflexota bacterium]
MNDLTFEQSIAQLEAIVERLQRPDIPLDEALSLYKTGTELAAQSEAMLNRADLQIQQLTGAVKERFGEYDVGPESSSNNARTS